MSAVPAAAPGRDCDYIFKIIVIGDSGVGKSSLTVRLSEDVFYKDYASTIAIDFRMYFMHFLEKRIRLQIWDTAGQERFQSVATAFSVTAAGPPDSKRSRAASSASSRATAPRRRFTGPLVDIDVS